MSLGSRVRELRDSRGMSQDDVAEKANVDRSYISRIEKGSTKLPSVDVIAAIAGALGTTTQDLLQAAAHQTPPPSPPPRKTEEILREALVALEREHTERRVRMLPVFGARFGAGPTTGAPADEVPYAPTTDEENLDLIVVIVSGDCMAPRIENGDEVIVDTSRPWQAGHTVAVRHENEYIVKRVERRDDQWLLVADNGQTITPNNETTVLGVVLRILKRP